VAKIGEGSLAAMGRLGLKELRNAFNPSRESVADSELGMYGTATQTDINAERGTAPERLTLEGLRTQARDNQTDRGRDDREQERGGHEM
jgi:hypothetical protein